RPPATRSPTRPGTRPPTGSCRAACVPSSKHPPWLFAVLELEFRGASAGFRLSSPRFVAKVLVHAPQGHVETFATVRPVAHCGSRAHERGESVGLPRAQHHWADRSGPTFSEGTGSRS